MVESLRRLVVVALLACMPLAATTVPARAVTSAPTLELIQPAQYYYHRGYYPRPYYRPYYRPFYRPYYGPRFYHPYYHRRFYRPY